MSITVDYSTIPWLITVPKSDLTLESGTKYTLTVDTFWTLLRDYADSPESMPNPIIYTRIPATASTPSITAINLDYYLMQFEDGAYSVNIINGNTNIREAEVKNSVSVNTNNTTGFIDPTFLEAGLFNDEVVVDVIDGVAGVGETASGAIIGTRQAPSNNWVDANLILDSRGLGQFKIIRDTTIDNAALAGGHNYIGSSALRVEVTLDALADLQFSTFKDLNISGVADGDNLFERCSITGLTSFSGIINNCFISGNITLGNNASSLGCYSNTTGFILEPSIYDYEINELHGSITISGMTAGTGTVEVYGGTITLDATCSGGIVNVVGSPYEIVDNSTGTTIIDQTGDVVTKKALTLPQYIGLK